MNHSAVNSWPGSPDYIDDDSDERLSLCHDEDGWYWLDDDNRSQTFATEADARWYERMDLLQWTSN